MSEQATNEAQNPEVFEKLNDYTLSVVNDFARQSQADPELRRIFNFAAQNITTIYSMWYGASVTSSMQTQRFSELDSLNEVERMHRKLVSMGGQPPALPQPDSRLPKGSLRPPQAK